MSYRKFQTYFFVTILTLSGILTLLVFRPYLTLLAFGGVLAIVSRPIYRKLLAWIKSETSAAFLTIVIVATVILVPTFLFFAMLTSELGTAFSSIRDIFAEDSITEIMRRVLPANLQLEVPSIVEGATSVLREIASSLSQNLVAVFSNVFHIFFGAVVVLISAYYLLKDGAKVKKELLAISPLGDEHDELVFQKVSGAVSAVMNGLLIVGLIKGILSALFFWFFGVPAPLFWGSMSGFASLIPFFGSGIVTFPAVAYLLVTGHSAAAIGLGILSVGLIGMVDNFLQPKLVSSKIKIHPLLILLSILGGLKFYGFSGFILGPLTLAVLMAFVDIYKKEFRAYIERG